MNSLKIVQNRLKSIEVAQNRLKSIKMDVGELLSFKPATAPKRPAPTDDHDEVEDEDDPSELIFIWEELYSGKCG